MSEEKSETSPTAPPPRESSPFGGTTRRALLVRVVVATVALGGAVVLALLLTRSSPAPEAEAGHAHGAAAPSASEGQPVMLDQPSARRIGVTFAPVVYGTLATEIRTVAQVTYDETRVTSISPKIDGWVEELFINYTGQPVEVGQPLLTIYSPMLVSAQQELLLADQLAPAVAAAEGEARQGVSELRDAARRRLQYWDISDAQIARLVQTGDITKTMTLRSKVRGLVLQKNVVEGQRIMAGESLYRIADLSVVWLEGEVFERDLSAVRLGQSVAAEFDAFAGESRVGRITYIYPILDADTRTVRIRVEFNNPGLRLKPGMYGTIRIVGSTAKPSLLVPRSAVLATGERRLVFVRRKDGMLEPRDIVIGMSSDDQTQILAGVAVGDTVVRSATFLVDAESNLGSALGGMGGMPGMDMAPSTNGKSESGNVKPPPPKSSAPAPSKAKGEGTNRAGHGE